MSSVSLDKMSGSMFYDPEMGDWLIEPVRASGSTFSPLAQIFRPISQPPPAPPVACAVCLAQDSFNEGSVGVSIRRATSGKLRCHEHAEKCAYCLADCSSDKFLLCEGCCNSGAASCVYEALEKSNYSRLEAENRICVLDASCDNVADENKTALMGQSLWACGCVSCISETSAFYLARSLEEGSSSASSLSSIEVEGSHVGFQITEALLTP